MNTSNHSHKQPYVIHHIHSLNNQGLQEGDEHRSSVKQYGQTLMRREQVLRHAIYPTIVQGYT